MGIYLPNMEMPQKNQMLVIFPDGTSYVCFNGMRERLTQTTAVPIPPHGRLIDADELMLKIQDYIEEYSPTNEHGMHDLKWCAMKEAEMAINDAPTIIESEGEE